MNGSSDIPKIPLVYHPSCRASSKLFNLIGQDNMNLFQLIDISTGSIPCGVTKVPSIQYEDRFIHGKDCFDKVSKLISGPISCDIYKTGSKIEAIGDDTEFSFNPQYSTIDGKKDTGVPKYIENNMSLDSLIKQRGN